MRSLVCTSRAVEVIKLLRCNEEYDCCLLLTVITMILLQAQDFAEHNDAILLVVVPAASVREVSTSRALKLAQELDSDGTPINCLFNVNNVHSSTPFMPAFWLFPLRALGPL